MDWPPLDLELSESTFGYFKYEQRYCAIVRKLVTDEVSWNQSVELILCRDPSCGTCVLKQSGILGLKRQVVEN
jgi:hypothetical protein